MSTPSNNESSSKKSSHYAIYMKMNLLMHLRSLDNTDKNTSAMPVIANIDEKIAAAVLKNQELNAKLSHYDHTALDESINSLTDANSFTL